MERAVHGVLKDVAWLATRPREYLEVSMKKTCIRPSAKKGMSLRSHRNTGTMIILLVLVVCGLGHSKTQTAHYLGGLPRSQHRILKWVPYQKIERLLVQSGKGLMTKVNVQT